MTLGLLERGSSRGTAFPSLHVAITVTQSLFALAWYRSLGVVLSFATVLLAVGAVYGGYHYVVDVLAGALLGLTAGSVLCLIHRTRSTSAE
jgi:membrane-associated phospholipid phosphatase